MMKIPCFLSVLVVLAVHWSLGARAQTVDGGCAFSPCQPSVVVQPNSVLQSNEQGQLFFGPLTSTKFHTPPQCVSTAIAGGTSDALTIPALPCIPTTTLVILTSVYANATTKPTLKVGTANPQVILSPTGMPLQAGQIPAHGRVLLTNNGANWFLLAPLGNGGTTPSGVVLVGGDTTSCTLAGGDTTTCVGD